jgi:hypothetical protein
MTLHGAFYLFPLLPPELRDCIWELSLSNASVTAVLFQQAGSNFKRGNIYLRSTDWDVLTIAQTCREARSAMNSVCQLVRLPKELQYNDGKRSPEGLQLVWINFDVNVFYFGAGLGLFAQRCMVEPLSLVLGDRIKCAALWLRKGSRRKWEDTLACFQIFAREYTLLESIVLYYDKGGEGDRIGRLELCELLRAEGPLPDGLKAALGGHHLGIISSCCREDSAIAYRENSTTTTPKRGEWYEDAVDSCRQIFHENDREPPIITLVSSAVLWEEAKTVMESIYTMNRVSERLLSLRCREVGSSSGTAQ